jgi:hypothetical protein
MVKKKYLNIYMELTSIFCYCLEHMLHPLEEETNIRSDSQIWWIMSRFNSGAHPHSLPESKHVVIGSSAPRSLKAHHLHLSKHVLEIAMVPSCCWLFMRQHLNPLLWGGGWLLCHPATWLVDSLDTFNVLA